MDAPQFSKATPVDIIESNQKDMWYLKSFSELIFDVISRLAGPAKVLHLKKEIELLSNLIFYCCTTIAGSRTLGEEYVEIIQVKTKPRIFPPGLLRRLLLVVLNVVLPYLFEKMCTKLLTHARSDKNNKTKKQKKLNQFILDYIPFTKELIPKLSYLHLALFYINGTYYQLGNRITGIQYIFNFQGDSPQRTTFNYLGWLILIQTFVNTGLFFLERFKKSSNNNLLDLSKEKFRTRLSKEKCGFCLSERDTTTSTPCGHLFCWNCILEWTQTKPECPSCRQPVKLKELRVVYNL